MKKITFLGIETSCDETAAAVIQSLNGKPKILSNVVLSQIKQHARYGGVVPELAARTHIENIDKIISKALQKSKLDLKDIDGVAATTGPGLVVCLNVGSSIGKSLAGFLKKPFIAVNHLEGHALSPALIHQKISYPYLLLLISGGHSQFLMVKSFDQYVQLGTTIDDAVGEAFDKTAKLLGLGYPGGAKLEKFAVGGDEEAFILPFPLFRKAGSNLSFAGLKTAVMRIAENLKLKKHKKDLAASFQKIVEKILEEKTKVAMEQFRAEMGFNENFPFIIAGGVAANKKIRARLKQLAEGKKFTPIFPPLELCGDNAAMIAWVGIQKFKRKKFDSLNTKIRSRWPLDASAPFLKGPGLKL